MIKRTTPVIIKMISHVASCEDESVKKKNSFNTTVIGIA